MAPRGRALPVSVSPLAMPMRLSPKSRARTRRISRSGMTGERRELSGLDAEQPERCEPALLVGQIEDHALVGGHREPGIVEHLALELAGFPTRVTECDEGLLRAGAGGHGREYVARGRDLDGIGNAMRRVPLAARTMQHEAEILVPGTAAQYRQAGGAPGR